MPRFFQMGLFIYLHSEKLRSKLMAGLNYCFLPCTRTSYITVLVLYCTVLYCTVLYYTVLHCTSNSSSLLLLRIELHSSLPVPSRKMNYDVVLAADSTWLARNGCHDEHLYVRRTRHSWGLLLMSGARRARRSVRRGTRAMWKRLAGCLLFCSQNHRNFVQR